MSTVTFQPAGVSVVVKEGTSVLQAALDNAVAITTSCGGKAQCRECIIQVVEGEKVLSPVCKAEEKLLGNVYFITKERLSCQTLILGDGAVIHIPPPREKPKRPPRRPRPYRTKSSS